MKSIIKMLRRKRLARTNRWSGKPMSLSTIREPGFNISVYLPCTLLRRKDRFSSFRRIAKSTIDRVSGSRASRARAARRSSGACRRRDRRAGHRFQKSELQRLALLQPLAPIVKAMISDSLFLAEHPNGLSAGPLLSEQVAPILALLVGHHPKMPHLRPQRKSLAVEDPYAVPSFGRRF